MAKRTDGHVQWNGTHFQFFLTKHPGLKCETADCSTCKERSKAWDQRLADEADVKAHEVKVADGKRVEAAAAKAVKDGEAKGLHDAAAMLNEAVRTAAIGKRKVEQDAEADAAAAIAKARGACKDAEQKAQDALAKVKAKAQADYLALVEKAKATDWLAKVAK